jgi:hypothetical protein
MPRLGQAFQTAATIFERIAPGGIQSAHVDMQLAAFSLRRAARTRRCA